MLGTVLGLDGDTWLLAGRTEHGTVFRISTEEQRIVTIELRCRACGQTGEDGESAGTLVVDVASGCSVRVSVSTILGDPGAGHESEEPRESRMVMGLEVAVCKEDPGDNETVAQVKVDPRFNGRVQLVTRSLLSGELRVYALRAPAVFGTAKDTLQEWHLLPQSMTYRVRLDGRGTMKVWELLQECSAGLGGPERQAWSLWIGSR